MLKLSRPKFWETRSITAIFLLLFSFVYYTIYNIIRLFRLKYKSKSKLICVGNASIGGSGKTPIVLELSRLLQEKNIKFCIVTRGYLGKISGPVIVDINKHSSYDVGDEALLLAKSYTTIVSKSKKNAILYAELLGYEYVIIDDGMQNHSLHYDVIIMALDNNLGNKFLLPAGPMRETLNSAIKKANFILVNEKYHSKFSYINKKLIEYKIISNFDLKNKRLILFSGIANPEKFFNFIDEKGAIILEKLSFPDHYNFCDKEIEEIILKSEKLHCKILTTEKDYVRLKEKHKKYIDFAPIEIVIYNVDQIVDFILTK